MTDARKRIAELEEALKYFLDRTWFNLVSDTLPDNHVVSMDARIGDLRRAALLLSEQTETPVEETGDVERVKAAIMACLKRGGELEPDDPEVGRFWEFAGLVEPDELARAALSAMRPVSVDLQAAISDGYDLLWSASPPVTRDEFEQAVRVVLGSLESQGAPMLSALEGGRP
jgi:hypothetical protein